MTGYVSVISSSTGIGLNLIFSPNLSMGVRLLNFHRNKVNKVDEGIIANRATEV
jgi:hypothetical protein